MEFIDEPDDSLTCRICLEVARDPWQHGKCGVLFCRKCITMLVDHACPHCRRAQPEYFEDSKSRREIRALRVRCDKTERGCKWEGTVGTLDDHVTKVCQFTLVPCPNKCDSKHLVKKYLGKHLKECPNREHQCEYCGKKDTYVSITEEHDKICEKKIVPCTNIGCTMTMERGKIEAHVANDCEYTEISCKYESIGCDMKIKRRDMGVHEENDQVHLQKALDAIVELKKTTKKLENETEKLDKTAKELKKTKKKLENKTEKLDNETQRLDKTAKELKKTTKKLEDETEKLENETQRLDKTAKELEKTTKKLENETETLDKITKELSRERKEREDTNRGSTIITRFKIVNFRQMKSISKCLTAPSFYTSPTGYHMYCTTYPNGTVANDGSSGIDTHVSVFVHITKGNYDKRLEWPVIGKVSFEALNQLEDKNHHKKEFYLTPATNIQLQGQTSWGFSQFIAHSELSRDPATNTQYLKDDTLQFRVSVQVPDRVCPTR